VSHLRPADPSTRHVGRRRIALAVASVFCAVLLAWAAAIALPIDGTHSLLARSAGISSYLLLVLLVLSGLLLSHPWSSRWRWPSPAARIRTHVSLAAATLSFTTVHVVMWATDDDGGVGWWGALVPWGSSYRPFYVTLGVLGLYAGLLAGVTASLAGRFSLRAWWPIHKVSVVALMLVWGHTLGGLDAPALVVVYVVTGVLLIAVAASRHAVRHHRAHAEDLAAVEARELLLHGTHAR
jgi:hypothetical protein